MAVNISPVAGAGWQFFDNNGDPLTGGLLYTYTAGTTTPVATYTSSNGLTANANPIVLDSAGRVTEEVWLTSGITYKFVLKSSTDVQIWSMDNITCSATASEINSSISTATSALQTNLANTSDNAQGDALIGFKQAGSTGFLTGASARTVSAKLQDHVSVKDFGAVGDGSASDAAAFALALAAVAATGQSLYIPSGTYKISSALSTTGHVNMFGDGPSTVLDFSGLPANTIGLSVTGSVTQIESVSSASLGGVTVTFSSVPSLSTGDVFCLYDSSVSWNGARTYYYSGEWCECRAVSGSSAQLTSPLYDSYSSSTVKAYKLSSPKVSLRNFSVRGGTNILGLIDLTYIDKPLIENVTAYSEGYKAIELSRCYRASIVSPNIYNKGTGTLDDYGLVISNSQKVRIIEGDLYARRHGLSIGGGDYTCAVPNRNVRVIGTTLSNDILSGVYSADMHGNVQDVVYENCTIYQGGGWAGMDVGYDGCKIYAQSGGMAVYASEVKGGEMFLRNCRITTYADPSTIGRGIVDVGGNSSAVTTSTNRTLSIIVENCYLFANAVSSGTDFVKFANTGSTVNVNIYIDGLRGSVNAMGTILRTEVVSGSAYSEAIVVDNISNFPTNTYLHFSESVAYASKPHRLMRQSGSVSMTATSGTSSTINSGITYRYKYPRVPVAVSTVGGDTGSFTNSNGQNIGIGQYSVTLDTIRPSLISTSNTSWTATQTVVVNWSVGIEEI